MLLLLMKNFNCINNRKIKDDLVEITDRSIKNNIKKAEEKILINKKFRDEYFELEEIIKENFKKA